MLSQTLLDRLSQELGIAPCQIAATLALFDEGNTLPFIARYRKEATGGLDEVQLRDVRDRAQYLRELEDRRAAILKSIEEQGKLDDALRARILDAADTKQALEDLYLPFKPKRRTRAMIALERGLEPLAELLWAGQTGDAAAEREAAAFVDRTKEVADVDAALAGRARHPRRACRRGRRAAAGFVRDATRARGGQSARIAAAGKEEEVSKFQDYYDFARRSRHAVAPHARVAARRGGGFPRLDHRGAGGRAARRTAAASRRRGRAATGQMTQVVQDAYKRLLAPSIEVELRLELKTRADEEAIVDLRPQPGAAAARARPPASTR